MQVYQYDDGGILRNFSTIESITKMFGESAQYTPVAIDDVTPRREAHTGEVLDFSQAEIDERNAPSPIPNAVDALNAFIAMIDLGYIDQYDAWVTDPGRTRREKVMAEKAKTWRRNDSFFVAAADALLFTEQQRDDFFIYAAGLDM